MHLKLPVLPTLALLLWPLVLLILSHLVRRRARVPDPELAVLVAKEDEVLRRLWMIRGAVDPVLRDLRARDDLQTLHPAPQVCELGLLLLAVVLEHERVAVADGARARLLRDLAQHAPQARELLRVSALLGEEREVKVVVPGALRRARRLLYEQLLLRLLRLPLRLLFLRRIPSALTRQYSN